jgi:hypothetical protein
MVNMTSLSQQSSRGAEPTGDCSMHRNTTMADDSLLVCVFIV